MLATRMKTWLVGYVVIWVLVPVLALPSWPEWAGNAAFNSLDKILRVKHGLTGLKDPEVHMDVPELVKSRGYTLEVHEVTTDDGYVLSLHRLSGQKSGSVSSPKPVVFFQHGMWQSSACWLINPVDKALAYVLADQGYDVWLGNFRGTTYSRKHTTYSDNDNKFWDFAWDEIARLDLPAMLKYILAKTGQKDLTFVGHSLGCTVFFAFADIYPELQSSINLMIGLGPASTTPNTRTPLGALAPYVNQGALLYKILGTNEFMPNTNLLRLAQQASCSKNQITRKVCEKLYYFQNGNSPSNFNASLLPVIYRHYPASSSVRTVAQFAQGVNSKKFQRYDFGKDQNRVHYSQDTPPEYSLENVKVPVVLFYSDEDLFVVPEDVATLANRLGNLKGVNKIPAFNHLDFLFALHVDNPLNKDVRKLIETYNPLV